MSSGTYRHLIPLGVTSGKARERTIGVESFRQYYVKICLSGHALIGVAGSY